MYLNEIESNALWKSISNNKPVLFLHLAHCIISKVFRMQSPMYLPFTKPDWSLWIIVGKTKLILFAITELISLYMLFWSVIGLQFSKNCLGFPPLGKREIIPMVWELGNLLIIKLYFMAFIIVLPKYLQKHL